MRKQPLCFAKLGKVPEQSSWVDQRLVRERYIDQLSHEACALYLFLLTVADARGLSYYSEHSLRRRLSMTHPALHQARRELIQLGLLAYDHPLYQVLALDAELRSPLPQAPTMTASDTPMAIKDIFKHLAETLS
jgi:replication initiation and membrane attachment protein DnaB